MIDQDYFDHLSLDGRPPWDRMAATGYDGLSAGAENIALSLATYPLDETATLLAMHDRLIVDKDVVGRGHRINLFKDGLRKIGIGAASGAFTQDGTSYPYAWALTCDFAARGDGPTFVLGVVYDDRNGDGAYTAGEPPCWPCTTASSSTRTWLAGVTTSISLVVGWARSVSDEQGRQGP